MGFFDQVLNKVSGAFNSIYKSVFGIKVVILGQRATGKTTLLRFLQTGEMTLDHNATIGVSKIIQTKEGKKRLKDLNWSIKLSKIQSDYAGTTGDYSAWIDGANEADVFIYLFNIKAWLDSQQEVEKQLYKDVEELSKVLDHKKDIPIFIIGTHLDQLDARLLYNSYDQRVKFIDDVQNMPFFKGLKNTMGGGKKTVYCHIGTLNTHSGMKETINYMLGRLVK